MKSTAGRIRMKRRTLRVGEGPDSPLRAYLAVGLSLSAGDAKALIERGAVYVDGRRCLRADAPLRAGQTVTVVMEEAGRGALDDDPPPPAPTVLFECDALLAVDKPAGVPAQPTEGRVGG